LGLAQGARIYPLLDALSEAAENLSRGARRRSVHCLPLRQSSGARKELPGLDSNASDYQWQPRFVEPQIGPGQDTDWPFFYEDRRNQFYVTVGESFVPFNFTFGFGTISVAGANLGYDIPKLIVGETRPPHIPPSYDTIIDPSTGGDPTGWSLLENDTPVVASFATGAGVQFQGRLIGALGSSPIVDNASIETRGD
jgi:hypothetical protein